MIRFRAIAKAPDSSWVTKGIQMKLNRLGAFTLGIVVTATTIGVIPFAYASSDVTLKACANKTTGAMRYIAKGKCKKTETSLSWSQMGPQGLPGASGSNASTVNVQDAAGTIFTYVGGVSPGILWNGLLWNFTSAAFSNSTISASGAYYFIDGACSIPIFPITNPERYGETPIQSTMVTTSDKKTLSSSRVLKAYKRKGTLITMNPAINYYEIVSNGNCTARLGGAENFGSPSNPIWEQVYTHYYEAEETAPLVFVPPLKFVVG